MTVARRVRMSRLAVETLEGRALLNASGWVRPAALPSAAVGRVTTQAIKIDPGGAAAITNALFGGMGSEWVTLIRRQVRNPQAVIRDFVSGRVASFTTAGFTARTPGAQAEFTGRAYDQLLTTEAGVAVFRKNVMELASIQRGEFRNPETSYYVFALDRGAGARLGPTFAARPKITPDALVTIEVGPYGTSATGTIRDLVSGSTQTIDASQIRVQGSTLRVFLDAGQLPSQGVPLARYRFAQWVQTAPGTDITTVASFPPDTTMTRIAVLKDVAVRR